jgi:response regulator RpfG family c-di-GMP phosphodiesterase
LSQHVGSRERGAYAARRIELKLIESELRTKIAGDDSFQRGLAVVEDDADVRAFTVETVRKLGYDVLEARDGNSALNVFKQAPADKIDLLFSDVVLPGGINVLDGQDSTRHVN